MDHIPFKSILRMIKSNPRYHGYFYRNGDISSFQIILKDLGFTYKVNTCLEEWRYYYRVDMTSRSVDIMYDNESSLHRYKLLKDSIYYLKELLQDDESNFYWLLDTTLVPPKSLSIYISDNVLFYDGVIENIQNISAPKINSDYLTFKGNEITEIKDFFNNISSGLWRETKRNPGLQHNTLIEYHESGLYQWYFINNGNGHLATPTTEKITNTYNKCDIVKSNEIILKTIHDRFYLDIVNIGEFLLDPVILIHGHNVIRHYNCINKITLGHLSILILFSPYVKRNKWRVIVDKKNEMFFN